MESKSKVLFLQQTIEVWQPYSKETLSLEDAQEIVENITGFFKLLMEWDAQQKLRVEKVLDSLPSTIDNIG